MAIQLENIYKSFTNPDGSELVVLDGVSFEIEDNSFTTIMGPSGCGKSTLLNILSGLIDVDDGTIRNDGTQIAQGNIPYAFVFQEPRLLNWLTVEDNIKFALKAQNVPEKEHDNRVRTYLKMVDLAGEEQSYPSRMSGGMRQRVGLARALAVEQDVLLMDEPFSALDELTAQNLRADVIDLWVETNKTIVFVTHNISEAVYLSDTILFMNNQGEIFNRASIDIERPRDFQNQKLLKLESDLMNTFFDGIKNDN